MDNFASNLRRLSGMHDLTQTEVGELLGLTKGTLSSWNAGRRSPSFATAQAVAKLFRISEGRLAQATFDDLLEHELADPKRFHEVEQEIHRRRHPLKAVSGEDV
jgi:transcriptional regulator with XRE-family HTH domain